MCFGLVRNFRRFHRQVRRGKKEKQVVSFYDLISEAVVVVAFISARQCNVVQPLQFLS